VISDPRGAYAEAAGWFVELVRRVDGDWDAPALGSWSRRDLVGHTSRSLLTVESYLRDGPVQAEAASAVDYFVRSRAALADAEAVAARGRAAGQALGDDPAAAVAEIAERVLPLVAAAGVEAYVETPVATMQLHDYLPTRTVELVVHGCDLAVACGLAADVPMTAAAQTGAVLVALAAHDGAAADLLLSATGRRPLPAGFTVL
jgi:Mycothiol maleylpyruvate isomerase N-terminal domain